MTHSEPVTQPLEADIPGAEADFYTFQEAAQKLGVSDKTLRKALDDGAIPYVQLGAKTIRIRKDVIDEMGRQAETAS